MRIKAKACDFPIHSLIFDESRSANFKDSFAISTDHTELDVLEIYLRMVSNTPKWINALLSLRNNLVRFFGLKHVGNLVGKSPLDLINRDKLLGAKLDFFTIETLNNDEMILILKDNHLDIKLSVMKAGDIIKNQIFVSTVVNYNNLLGNIYMFFITPFHKIVVKRLMNNIIKSQNIKQEFKK